MGSFYSNGGMQMQTLNVNENPVLQIISCMEPKVHAFINALYKQVEGLTALVQV